MSSDPHSKPKDAVALHSGHVCNECPVPAPFGTFDACGELRNMIYHCVLNNAKYVHEAIALSQTCRAARTEFRPLVLNTLPHAVPLAEVPKFIDFFYPHYSLDDTLLFDVDIARPPPRARLEIRTGTIRANEAVDLMSLIPLLKFPDFEITFDHEMLSTIFVEKRKGWQRSEIALQALRVEKTGTRWVFYVRRIIGRALHRKSALDALDSTFPKDLKQNRAGSVSGHTIALENNRLRVLLEKAGT